jgi:hypothetical protein
VARSAALNSYGDIARSNVLTEISEKTDMKNFVVLTAAVALVAAHAFAEESAMNLHEGEAIMVTPKGTVHKATRVFEHARHEAALKAGAKEVATGTVFYLHGGKLYGVTCAGPYIGGWEEGYPGTEGAC